MKESETLEKSLSNFTKWVKLKPHSTASIDKVSSKLEPKISLY